MSKKSIIVWQCPDCKDIIVSCSWVTHNMNYCKCKKSACDYEGTYVRWIGNPFIMKAKRYDLEELLNN